MTTSQHVRPAALVALAAGLLSCSGSVTAPEGAQTGIVVEVQPPSAQIATHDSVSFAALVTGTANIAVTWTVQEGSAGGSVTTSGTYTAPSTIGTYHVVATSQADPSRSGVATVTTTTAPVVAVTVSPHNAYPSPGQTVSFTATVTGTSNGAVTWSVQEATGCGAVTSAGLYTAPSAAASCHVMATSQADTSKSDVATVTVTAAPSTATPLAIDITNDGIVDWSPEPIFADAWKASRPYSGTVDANAWPTSDGTVVVFDTVPKYMQGNYAMSFVGQAVISGATIQNQSYNSATNTTTATIVAGSNLTLTFSKTRRLPTDTSATGFTNLKLIRSGNASTDTFDYRLLAQLAANNNMFTAIRYMGANQAINSKEANWTDRWGPNRATYGLEGSSVKRAVAWEYVVALANLTNKDAWISLPYSVTDDYITKVAQLFLYGSDANGTPYTSVQASPVHPPLDPGLKVYVEFGNELWNGAFPMTTTNRNDAVASVSAGDPYHLAWDGATDPYTLAYRHTAYEIVRVSNLFRTVFGDAAMMTRVRPILAGQCANSFVLRTGLAYVNAVWGSANSYGNPQQPVNYYIYGIAIAPYNDPFGNTDPSTLDNLFAQMTTYNTTLAGWINTHHGYAVTYDVKLLAYEGGQGLWGATGLTTKVAAQSDPRMQGIIATLLHNWFAAGPRAEAFFYWNLCTNWNSNGSWGLSTDITSQATPKWDGMKQVAAGL